MPGASWTAGSAVPPFRTTFFSGARMEAVTAVLRRRRFFVAALVLGCGFFAGALRLRGLRFLSRYRCGRGRRLAVEAGAAGCAGLVRCSAVNPRAGRMALQLAAQSPGMSCSDWPETRLPRVMESSMHTIREWRPDIYSCEIGCYQAPVTIQPGILAFTLAVRNSGTAAEFMRLYTVSCPPAASFASLLPAGHSSGTGPAAGAGERLCPALIPIRNQPIRSAIAESDRSAPTRSRCLLSWW